MPEKKKQHYIPQFYMQSFANSDKSFAVYNLSNKSILYPVPYRSQCYKDYYYGKDGILEEQLSKMETIWANVIKDVVNKKQLNAEHIKALKQFALYQRQRTVAELNYSKQTRTELLIEQIKTMCAIKGWKYEKTYEEMCIQRANESIAPAELLHLADKYLNFIDDLSIVIIEYKTNCKLISSDVPVISINPFHQQTIGYGCMGLIMLYPISSQHLVVIYDSKMYPKYKGKLYVEISNENEVLNANVLQLISAEKILFGNQPHEFNEFNEKHWEFRDLNRNSKSVHTLGPNDHKMIGTSMRKAVYDHVFSFGKIAHEFANIPFSCREAVPRLWEKEWQNKLETKPNIMSQISEHQPDMLKTLGMTKKEFRRGFEMMAKAAKKYWNA